MAAPVFNSHRMHVWDVVEDCDLCCGAEHMDLTIGTQDVPLVSKCDNKDTQRDF